MNTQERLTKMDEVDVSDVSEIVKELTSNKVKFVPVPCKNDSEFKLMMKIMKTRMKNIVETYT